MTATTHAYPACPKCGGLMDRVRYVVDCGKLRPMFHCRLNDEIVAPADDVRAPPVPFDDPDNHEYDEAVA